MVTMMWFYILPTFDFEGNFKLLSAFGDVLMSSLVSIRDRSFAVAGPRLCNTLPDDITSVPSLPFSWIDEDKLISADLS